MVVVGVSDAKVSKEPEDVIITHALGSCIGVVLYDEFCKVGGMLHFQLPSSKDDPQRAEERPLMYADTGMKWLLGQMDQAGANCRRLRVSLAGGANMLYDRGLFDIGRRNHASIRKIMWQYGLFIHAEQVGGKAPRTLQLSIGNGAISIKSNGAMTSL